MSAIFSLVEGSVLLLCGCTAAGSTIANYTTSVCILIPVALGLFA
ncbi:MAG: hypothetical protein ACC612_03270 [Methanomethylovorans sp.]